MTITAVIAVKGRTPLLKQTIRRLFGRNMVQNVVCVGDKGLDQAVCESLGCQYVVHPNFPLGLKWNAGFAFAGREIDPDAFLFVGSSDWISDNWTRTAGGYLQHADMAGKTDMHLVDVGKPLEYGQANDIRACYWPGYTDNERKGETIGLGRMIGRDMMRKMKYKPFNEHQNASLDYAMYNHILSHSGKIVSITDDSMRSVSPDRSK